MNKIVNVIGAGLAGSEAAFQLASRGVSVRLFEMKPEKKIPAHSTDNFCELCCSNSFRAEGLSNAVGVLKEELRRMGSLIMRCADATRVPAGGALAVDRDRFAAEVTAALRSAENIEIIEKEVRDLNFEQNTIVASGPLTSDALSESIHNFFGKDELHFFDAAAPIIFADSIDMSKAYLASRYGKGTADYINCPMDREQYDRFYDALITAETAKLHDFENDKVFEGCMPVEVMASRGRQTLLFGPLKPVGLPDSHTGRLPYAVVQLRKDNGASSMYNIVGFQTHLLFGEQKRVFSMIPGLENAEFARYGVMHRNTFINSPGLLLPTYETKKRKGLFFAGQMTGVEGYIESCSSGFVAALNAVPGLEKPVVFSKRTAIGALAHYISNESIEAFEPMNVNFGLFESADPFMPNGKKRKKADRKAEYAERALAEIDIMKKEYGI